jgi:6-phosphogluconolactonase
MVAESGLLGCLPRDQVHRLRGEDEPAREAERYERELCSALGNPPRLDLVLLGLGADGHTASLFPGTASLREVRWVAVGRAPTPPHRRLTLTFPTLTEARSVVFLAAGRDKAAALARALGAAARDALPAGRVRPRDGTVVWLIERTAATLLAECPGEGPESGLRRSAQEPPAA